MKHLIIIILFITCHVFIQDLKQLETIIGMDFDFGIQVQKDWQQRDQLLEAIASNKKSWNNLTDQEAALLEKYDETYSTMWDVEGAGCSWYCGAGDYTVSASSFLKSENANTYSVNNISDFSYQTAWVEGVKGYGIGESVTFSFVPNHPRLTTIKIANGYIKSKTTWKNNSRVKKFKLYINDTVYGVINLKDRYALQSIRLDKPIGYSQRKDQEKLKTLPNWKIKFEILEVYKGDKYDDTALSQIFFDGIDVH